MQEKHKTLGCTLVVTQNHLITLREDFLSPLRKITEKEQQTQEEENAGSVLNKQEEDLNPYLQDTGSLVSQKLKYYLNPAQFYKLLSVVVPFS